MREINRLGSGDGSIRVWGGASLGHERTLRDEKFAEGHLISGKWRDSGASGVPTLQRDGPAVLREA
jgi:hypothetical protein